MPLEKIVLALVPTCWLYQQREKNRIALEKAKVGRFIFNIFLGYLEKRWGSFLLLTLVSSGRGSEISCYSPPFLSTKNLSTDFEEEVKEETEQKRKFATIDNKFGGTGIFSLGCSMEFEKT